MDKHGSLDASHFADYLRVILHQRCLCHPASTSVEGGWDFHVVRTDQYTRRQFIHCWQDGA